MYLQEQDADIDFSFDGGLVNIVVQNFVATHFMSITESYNFHGPGGLAQCTSHPPLEQEDPGSNPARL
jgi:hypothetical protein